MARRSDDYIPTYADRMNELEKQREYARKHGDPRAKYRIRYTLYGKEHTEDTLAITQTEAIEICKKGWAINGVYINVLGATMIEKSEAEQMAEAKEKENDGAGVQS